jgi:hypothetical protein
LVDLEVRALRIDHDFSSSIRLKPSTANPHRSPFLHFPQRLTSLSFLDNIWFYGILKKGVTPLLRFQKISAALGEHLPKQSDDLNGASMFHRQARKRRNRMISNGLLLIFGVLLVSWGCEQGQTTIISDDMVGVWKTSDKKYEDRFIELKKDIVILGQGDGNESVQPIQKVTLVRQKGKELYTVHYLNDEGDKDSISFFYDPAGGIITLKNQRNIEWTKETRRTE